MQSIIPLKNGGGMRLTISKYYLPSGASISEVGVKPDILVKKMRMILKLILKVTISLIMQLNYLKSDQEE